MPLAAFWANLLGGEIAAAREMVVAVRTDRRWLMALRVPDFVPPDWPGGVDDLDVAEAEAIRLGAGKAAEQPGPDRWRVPLDPAGHPSCLTTQIAE